MKHTTTMTTYRATREESENIVRMLVENYPKTFFENPRQRRPLKKNIAADIIADKVLQVTDEAIIAAVDWYKKNIGYQGYAMSVPGALRVNLNGDVVGKVTPMEASEAQKILDDYHAKKNAEQANNPVRVLNDMYANGRVTDDGVRKVDAPTRAKAVAIAPEFAQLYETLTIANSTVAGITEPTMRLAIARAVIEEVIRKAGETREELKGEMK
jgi:sRNA-binding protein